jgi:DNA-binding SARP family transcriptional activator
MESLRGSAHRAVIRVHIAEINIAEAVRAYAVLRDLLVRELGVAPTAQMHNIPTVAGRSRAPDRPAAPTDARHPCRGPAVAAVRRP